MFDWFWSLVLPILSPILTYIREFTDALQADPGTHPYVLWLISLEWWEWSLIIAGIFALLIGTKRVLRWPVFLAVILFLAAELAAYFAVRYVVYLLEAFVFRASKASVRKLRDGMKQAETYQEWSQLASQADTILKSDSWKAHAHSRYYNYPLLANLLSELRAARRTGDVPRLTSTLQTCLHKNPAGILNEHLYSKTLVGTKYAIDEYIQEVMECLRFLKHVGVEAAAMSSTRSRPVTAVVGSSRRRTSRSPAGRSNASTRKRSTSRNGRSTPKRSVHAGFGAVSPATVQHASPAPMPLPLGSVSGAPDSAEAMLSWFQSAKRQYGATALCLSGGASIGNYHWGTVLALLNEGLLPRVLSGTSSGAVVAAVVGTRTDDELRACLKAPILQAELNSFEESWFRTGWRFWQKRVMYDQSAWLQKLQWFAHSHAISRMTFLEAHQRTGRILNITCTSQRKHNPAMLLNYLTTPNVCIDTAILASAAVPGFIEPVVLMEKINGQIRPYHDKDLQWCDGSLQRDLPLAELSEQFGANFFLVAQCNPHIIPFFFNARGQSGTPSSWRRRTGGYRGGFLLSALELFLKEDMKKNLRVLSELDLVPNLMGSDFSFLFLQDFQGQITMVPNATLRDYLRIICDPTEADLDRFLREGRLTAFRKFSMIRNRVLVGNLINECIRDLIHLVHSDQDPNEEPGTSTVHQITRSRRGILEQEFAMAQL